ncbi:unnamed protein product, partial [Mesorhabditis spiculigera]
MVQQVIDLVVLLLKVLVGCIVGSIRAFLPNGILPRKKVQDDVVLITGAGSGLGRLLAVEFGKLGAQLVLWDINESGNLETQKMLQKQNVKVHAYTVDLSDRKSVNATSKQTLADVGRVDILINNAGIVTGKKLFDCPDELMEKTVAVNSTAHFFTAKNFLRGMLDRDHGHVVTLASMAGKTGVAGLVDYCASKHAAVGFHESLTSEIRHLGKQGVQTTCVCPFYIDTGMFDGVVSKSPVLLPILQPEYVVECIMEAVLTGREYLILPRFCYFAVFAHGVLPSNVFSMISKYFGIDAAMDSFLPSAAYAAVMDYFGANETMDHFVGRNKPKSK